MKMKINVKKPQKKPDLRKQKIATPQTVVRISLIKINTTHYTLSIYLIFQYI